MWLCVTSAFPNLNSLGARVGVLAFAANLRKMDVVFLQFLVNEAVIYGTDKEWTPFDPREETCKDLGEWNEAADIGARSSQDRAQISHR